MVIQAISDTFQVDDTPFLLVQKPRLLPKDMQLSYRIGTQCDNSVLRLTWNSTDPESPLIKHIAQLHTFYNGKDLKQISHLGNENHVSIQADKNDLFKNGDKYTAIVTACNVAELCSSSESDDLLIDASPPHFGGPPMTWENDGNNSIIMGTCCGFSEVESELEKYFVTVSKDYSGSELSGGVIVVKTYNQTEQNASVKLTKQIN